MINNFDELKKQLRDLSSIINGFKSEAVQLRIMELIFQGAPDHEDDEEPNEAKNPKRKRKGKKTASTRKPAPFEGKKKLARSGKKSGPATVLTQLIEEGFFKANRTLNAIMDHSGKKKARKFKPNELSGPLARFVRDHRLDRDKNKDGQYEYFKK